MLHIAFCDVDDRFVSSFDVEEIRIARGVISSPRGDGCIATYTLNGWTHHDHRCVSLFVAGSCCLLFGITREPSFVSDATERLTLTGASLATKELTFAHYMPKHDMWQGLVRPIWWTAMRVVAAEILPGLYDIARMKQVSPWEPQGYARLNYAHADVSDAQLDDLGRQTPTPIDRFTREGRRPMGPPRGSRS
jgi:hypothetical protein